MIFNCLNCGLSISTKRETCVYCKTKNSEIIQTFTRAPKPLKSEKHQVKTKFPGTILSFVLR